MAKTIKELKDEGKIDEVKELELTLLEKLIKEIEKTKYT